jgi:hypothetical protein
MLLKQSKETKSATTSGTAVAKAMQQQQLKNRPHQQ